MPTPTKITRKQVLAKAMAILNEHGPEALSMRELAKRLGVKAPSLYRYYPDKVSLEREMVENGNRLLLTSLKAACRRSEESGMYHAAGRAYRRFALAKPHLYLLMMEKRVVFPPVSQSGKALWTFVLTLVRDASGHSDGTAYAVALWSFLHGFVSLEQAGQFGASGPRDGFQVGIQALAAGFKAGKENPGKPTNGQDMVNMA
jgi:AcrR family transcriptional regulator